MLKLCAVHANHDESADAAGRAGAVLQQLEGMDSELSTFVLAGGAYRSLSVFACQPVLLHHACAATPRTNLSLLDSGARS